MSTLENPEKTKTLFRPNKTVLVVTIIIVVVSAINIISTKLNQTSFLPMPTSAPIPELTPTPSPISTQLELLNTFPSDSKPGIGNTNSSIVFQFNRPLSLGEMQSLTSTISPYIEPKVLFDVNHQIVYINPAKNWVSSTTYTVTVSVSGISQALVYTFTPNTVQKSGVNGEEHLPTP